MARIFDLAAALRLLAADRRGNIAVTFAVAVIPFIFMVGAALDYSGAADLQVRLQRATDATALQLCQMARTSTLAQRQQSAQASMVGYMEARPFTIPTLTVSASPYQVYILAKASYSTAVVSIMGTQFKTIDVAADAQCQAEQQTFEIALVLDTTGSMAASSGSQSKIDALKEAATKFVNFVYATPSMAQTKISIVPFAAAVAVTPSTQLALR
jgi:Flp pilus assembly protein TadG